MSREGSDKDDYYERKSLHNSGFSGSSIGEYMNPGGASMLDISTRLRITEAELSIVRSEVSDLVAEKNALEVQCQKHENSWKFALLQLGRTIDERNEALAQIPPRPNITRDTRSPEMKLKKMKAPALKTELEHCLQQLDTQTRVARQIEHERDKANDELEFCKSQINTLLMQHSDLLGTCAEVASERDKASAESKLLREELNKYDQELHNSIELELGGQGECGSEKDKVLLQQIRLLREEREQLQRSFHQNIEHYKKQLAKCNMDRRHTSTSADAMKALLQRRLESAMTENTDLRSELRASGEMISQLKEQLAQVRIACHHGNGYSGGDGGPLTHDDTPTDHSSQGGMIHLAPSSVRIPPLSQDSGISLYNSKNEGGGVGGMGSYYLHSELITPGNSSGYRVSSATGSRMNPYVPTASPFPEETREENSGDESSWI